MRPRGVHRLNVDAKLSTALLREEIEKQGGLKLIYIDPPFDVGADFSMDIEIGGDTFSKKPNILRDRLPRHLGQGHASVASNETTRA